METTKQRVLLDKQIAEISLNYSSIIPHRNRLSVSNSQLAYYAFREVWDENTIELYESIKVMLLNSGCQVLGIVTIAQGNIDSLLLDFRLIFGAALKAASTAIILAHNHPSGNLRFSKSDKRITQELIDAGKLLDIPLYDHLVISKDGYISYHDTIGIDLSKSRYKMM